MYNFFGIKDSYSSYILCSEKKRLQFIQDEFLVLFCNFQSSYHIYFKLFFYMHIESVKHAIGPLLIEIEKSSGSTIGISLEQKWTRDNRSVIVIEDVKPASIADR